MDTPNLINSYFDEFVTLFWEYLPNIFTALVILLVGLWIIRLFLSVLRRILHKKKFDDSVKKVALDLTRWLLKIALFITVISKLGIQTSSFVAILGAMGLAIGLALQGSLSNFAGGILILVFKPFRLGDFIESQGQSGTVKEIALFYSKILTPNGQLVVLPNGKLSNDNIVNYTAEGKRRDVLIFGISYGSDIKKAKEILLALMNEQENILEDPAPAVFVAELGESSVNLSARFWTRNEHFWPCHFYTLEEAKGRLEAAGIVIPFPQRDVHHYNLPQSAQNT